MHILGEMSKALTEGRREFSAHAPRIETMTIPTDKIREVIGSGGKVIREIVETSGAKVDINDDGTIKIASANADSIKKAYDMIYSIVAEPEEGRIYTGKVVKLVDFGAFVNFFGKRDGLVHVSQISGPRIKLRQRENVVVTKKPKLNKLDPWFITGFVDAVRRA